MIKRALFATANSFTPVFNTADLRSVFGGEDGKTLPLQNSLLKELETIAFPGSVFSVVKKRPGSFLAEVQTEEYPSEIPLFVDERFLTFHEEKPSARQKNLPSLDTILETMTLFVGTPYLWGGNSLGIPEILKWYPPKVDLDSLSDVHKHTWCLQGLDCSGLLYYATCGFTPRNTSSLIHLGKSVPTQGKQAKEWKLLPGDLIVWKGHVIVALDLENVIESLGGKGVIVTPLLQRIDQIENELKKEPLDDWEANPSLPENKRYIIRRWHPETL